MSTFTFKHNTVLGLEGGKGRRVEFSPSQIYRRQRDNFEMCRKVFSCGTFWK
jgi:hypothetical protein